VLALGVVAGAALLGPDLVTSPADAQTAKRYFMLVAGASDLIAPPSLEVEPSSSVPLRISVPSPRDLPPNSFLRLRGLPPAIALSDGYAIAPGVWAVPLASLSNLRIIVPVGVSGTSDVTVSLVAVDGAPIAETRIALSVRAPGSSVARAPLASPAAPQAPQTPQVALSPEARERALKLVERGEQELANGNVSQARGFFMRAADAGLAHGAIMLGATYDPGELSRLRVQGVQANPAEARRWYEKARELGAPDANDRLVALGRR
jgi:TPR repeat protein